MVLFNHIIIGLSVFLVPGKVKIISVVVTECSGLAVACRWWNRRERRDAARIGSGRIQISERLTDKEQRKDDRGGRYDRHRDGYEKGDAGERRRTDRDADDLGRGRYSRDVDNGYPSRLDRDEGFRSDRYDRDDSRAGKSRVDRDREDVRYDIRRKDGSFRGKVLHCCCFVIVYSLYLNISRLIMKN